MKRYSKIHLWGLNRQSQDIPTTASTTIVQSADTASLNKEIYQNKTNIQNLVTDIDNLVQKFEQEIEAKVGDEETLTKLQSDLNDLKELKLSFETFKETNKELLTELRNEIESKIASITTVAPEESLTSMRTELEGFLTYKGENDEKLTKLQGTLENQIDMVKNNLIERMLSTKTEFDEEIRKLSSKLDQSQNELTESIRGQNINEDIIKQVSDLQAKIDSSLSSPVNYDDISSVKEDLKNLASLGEKVKTSIEAEIDVLKNRVNENKTTSEQSLDNLKLMQTSNEETIKAKIEDVNKMLNETAEKLRLLEETAPTSVEIDFFNTKITSMDEKIETLINQYAFVDNDITKLKKYEDKINEFKTKIENLTTKDEEIAAKCSKNETNIQDSQKKIEVNKKSLQELMTKYESTASNMTNFKNQLEAQITEIKDKFADNGRVNQLQTNMRNILDKLEATKQNIEGNKEKIIELSTSLENAKILPQGQSPTIQTDNLVSLETFKDLTSKVDKLKSLPEKLEEFREKLESIVIPPAPMQNYIDPTEKLESLAKLIEETRNVVDQYASSIEFEKLPNLKQEILSEIPQYNPQNSITVLQFFSYDNLFDSEKINLQIGRPRYTFNFDCEIVGVTFYDPEPVQASLLINLGATDLILARSQLSKNYYYQELNYPAQKGNSLEFHSHRNYTAIPSKPSFYAEIYLRTS